MKDDLELGFVTPNHISSKENGAWLFETILSSLPDAMPERFGNYEPLEKRHIGEGTADLLDSWANPFLWTRNKPRVYGSVWFGKGIRHSAIRMTLESAGIDIHSAVSFLSEVAENIAVDFGYVYLFSIEELSDRSRYRKLIPFRRGVKTADLMEGIPDVAPVMVIGKPYLELFGIETVISSPAARIEELGKGSVLLQVCTDLGASQGSFASFDAKRNQIKAHLGSSAFRREDRLADCLPEFRFQDPGT